MFTWFLSVGGWEEFGSEFMCIKMLNLFKDTFIINQLKILKGYLKIINGKRKVQILKNPLSCNSYQAKQRLKGWQLCGTLCCMCLQLEVTV